MQPMRTKPRPPSGRWATWLQRSRLRKRSASAGGGKKPGRTFALGKVKQKELTLFTRQLSILQDAGLPILAKSQSAC